MSANETIFKHYENIPANNFLQRDRLCYIDNSPKLKYHRTTC